MKKILFFSIVFVLVFFIYFINIDNKTYYLSLGDGTALGATPYGGYDYGYTDYVKDYLIKEGKLERYIRDFSVNGYRTIDLLRDIEDNKSILVDNKTITIQQALIKADLVTLSIGINDIINMVSINAESDYQYVNEAMKDMDNLLKTVREFCKEKIVAVGYYKGDTDLYKFANSKYKELCKKYNIIYIDASDLFDNQNYFPRKNSIYLSKTGYEMIANRIINMIK